MRNTAYDYVRGKRPELYRKICVLSGIPDYELRKYLPEHLSELSHTCAQIEGVFMEIVELLLKEQHA